MLPSLEEDIPPFEVPRIHVLEVRRRTDPDQFHAWVLVEIIEHRTVVRGVLLDAALELKCKLLSFVPRPSERSMLRFRSAYWADSNRVRLTGWNVDSSGDVYVDPDNLRGNRVGTYLMDLIVRWARQWPEADVAPITLSATQGSGEDGLRRNRFYRNFGINFDFSTNKLAGEFLPMRAEGLKQCCSWKNNITVRELPQLLIGMFQRVGPY